MTMTYYGSKTFDGKEVFTYKEFGVLHDAGHESFKLRYKSYIVPEVGAEPAEHLDCLAQILTLSLAVAGIVTDDVLKGLSRYRISNSVMEKTHICKKCSEKFPTTSSAVDHLIEKHGVKLE